jgi:hypothetical protein
MGVVGRWTHVHEEDHDGLQVFRPAGTDLPPARGRTSLRLDAGGDATAGYPGPDDRGVTDDGSWSLSGDLLTVTGAAGTTTYQVVSVEADRLELRPLPDPPSPTRPEGEPR